MEALVEENSTVQWQLWKILQSLQERLAGAGRIWEEFYGNYSHKVKKEGELGAALNSLNCWTQSSVTPFFQAQ